MQLMVNKMAHELINPKSIVTIQHATLPPAKCIKYGGDCGAGGYCVKCVFEVEDKE
jgi:hypothetical protein